MAIIMNYTVDGDGRLIGKLTKRMFFEKAQSVGEHGDGGQRFDFIGGLNQSAPAQLLLVV